LLILLFAADYAAAITPPPPDFRRHFIDAASPLRHAIFRFH
jgi:hypothetical protein